MTRALIIDDHPIVIHGCRRVLEDLGHWEIFEANKVAAAYRLFLKCQPDFVIADLGIQGEGLRGLDLIQRMRRHAKRVGILVFSMHGDPIIVRRALDAGASGYLLKDTAPRDLKEAITTVRRGETFLTHTMAIQVATLGRQSQGNPLADLTPRELQILSLLAEGKPYAQMADILSISYKTVANTCSQLKTKLGAETLAQLIRIAVNSATAVKRV
jgi:DNA-binding NarL/FixJ family response regulator